MLRLDTNQPHPIGPVARLGGKTGLIGEGRKPDIDDPRHSDLFRSGCGRVVMTTLHEHQNQLIATEEQEGQRPSEHRTFY